MSQKFFGTFQFWLKSDHSNGHLIENLHMLLTTLVTNATSIVTVTMLVRTRVPTVNMITHFTKVRIGVGAQTERMHTYYYDPQKILTFFLFSRFSPIFQQSSLVILLYSLHRHFGFITIPSPLHFTIVTVDLSSFIKRVFPT